MYISTRLARDVQDNPRRNRSSTTGYRMWRASRKVVRRSLCPHWNIVSIWSSERIWCRGDKKMCQVRYSTGIKRHCQLCASTRSRYCETRRRSQGTTLRVRF